MHAAWEGQLEVVAALLAAGADVNTHNHKVRLLGPFTHQNVQCMFQSGFAVRLQALYMPCIQL